MDEAAFQRWLDGYVGAWKTYDEGAIGALFSEDAKYRFYPWDQPIRGRAAIVANWLEDKTTRFHGRPSTTRGRSKETAP